MAGIALLRPALLTRRPCARLTGPRTIVPAQREAPPSGGALFWHGNCVGINVSLFGTNMQLSVSLRARISALGELSRPLGETRAATLARALAAAVAADVSQGRNPDPTIDAWIRRLAAEIAEKAPAPDAGARRSGIRRIGDVLPEIHGKA